jgi:hypothetical protein
MSAFDPSPRPDAYPGAQIDRARDLFEAAQRPLLPNYKETREHFALVSYIKKACEARAINVLLHHSPNESPTSRRRILNAGLATSPGYPDIVCHRPFVLSIAGEDVRFSGLALELKRVEQRDIPPRDRLQRLKAKQAKHILRQADWLASLRECGWVAEFARGAAEAIRLWELCYE